MDEATDVLNNRLSELTKELEAVEDVLWHIVEQLKRMNR